ncbi:undecaprenyldiphospho-muramoylpentapeptide beta-N-acetylglucosaminyltransferase [Sneathiella litorea]|uniref:UDP-N-acetylglucosamine--N-acetylmuramyl-(pentapeptide) pyrophosphoryl-undecaprenol N-acetylglucosamine transferase n=1 Tax=Sneathiella litorea TaxID=2606216 RepID=A0A6L8WCI9_9PROT|nr:undecaprenyldiphospho-muramoylpentapeptide beta-N-acetylglucosaminyltransferase [Sneathiella litorea]MZR32484.1 undecaprenyldiphospho-muramoylpentapeptide beta-N-acetylglucosaminyltransferase [Sneathiella litorea]
MTLPKKQVVLASGGTGGHIFPARALAEELTARGFTVTLITDMRGEKYDELFPGVTVLQVKSGSPSIGGFIGKVKAVGALILGFLQSRKILRRIKPLAVVGFGGYPSMPPAAAAASLGIPLVLHEQNAVLGRVNKLLAGYAKIVATSFDHTESPDNEIADKMIYTGNPVRRAILPLFDKGYKSPVSGGPINLLVLGGSQGATVLSEVVPEALSALSADLKSRIHVTQQCRAEDIEKVRAFYQENGIDANLACFFENVAQLLEECHLAITRSGASTLSELTVAGRPSLLVPYKHAMDDHQRKNGENAVARGAARLILQDDFTVEEVSRQLTYLLMHPDCLSVMANAATSIGEIHAAEKLADLVERFKPANSENQNNGKAAA